jgi:hypothetical protein
MAEIRYRCATCGEMHEGVPDVGYDAPIYYYHQLAEEERRRVDDPDGRLVQHRGPGFFCAGGVAGAGAGARSHVHVGGMGVAEPDELRAVCGAVQGAIRRRGRGRIRGGSATRSRRIRIRCGWRRRCTCRKGGCASAAGAGADGSSAGGAPARGDRAGRVAGDHRRPAACVGGKAGGRRSRF